MNKLKQLALAVPGGPDISAMKLWGGRFETGP